MTATSVEAPDSQSAQQTQPRYPPRPDFRKIYAKPLPLETFPLPPLIPHNPLSVHQIAFVYLYQIFSPPSSHPKTIHKAYWSPETQSIHVTDEVAIRALWEGGFFGKGSLSRSEPNWLEREKRRRGLTADQTSEEYTIQRREERKKFKNERARLQREAIEEKLREENRSRASSGAPEPTARARFEGLNGAPAEGVAESIETLIGQDSLEPPAQDTIPLSNPPTNESTSPLLPPDQPTPQPTPRTQASLSTEIAAISNQEHLQLTPSEAFFLVYTLGILSIHSSTTTTRTPLSTSTLFTLFCTHSYFPPLPLTSLAPDAPFLLSYTTYHHFRSLGWVLRPGVKFAVDWLLYLRGPVFSHAEFAVIVLPAYLHPYWRSTPELEKQTRKKEGKTWWWLHCVNRVQSQVKKSLVLAYVEVPPPGVLESAGWEEVDIGRFLGEYRIRELTLKRWIPNRERD